MKKLILTSATGLFIGFTIKAISLLFIPTGGSKPKVKPITLDTISKSKSNGYWENGEIISNFNCPDAVKLFPPIDKKVWNKIPVVNGRLPTNEETQNGTAIHNYGGISNPNVKPYNMTLPKLAYLRNYKTKMNDIVVVIQIVQTIKDTIVGFRYLTGGCGGTLFRDFHFLTDNEVKKATENWEKGQSISKEDNNNTAASSTVSKQTTISLEAKNLAKQKLQDIKDRITKGEDFNKLATLYSDDPGSRNHGGCYDSIKRGMFVPEFEAAAFKLKAGEVSDIFETQYGFHIILLQAKRNDEVDVCHILIIPK